MLRTAITATIVSAGLWTAAITNVFTAVMSGSGGMVLTGGAVMTGIVASVLWVARILRNEDRQMLIRLSADLYRRIPEDDRPPFLRSLP